RADADGEREKQDQEPDRQAAEAGPQVGLRALAITQRDPQDDGERRAPQDERAEEIERCFLAVHGYGYFDVPSQPFSERSKITPSGSLYFTSKFASSLLLPSVKKNLPPAASTRCFASSRSSTWKPKWCAPTKLSAFFRPEPASPLYLRSARLITPSLR